MPERPPARTPEPQAALAAAIARDAEEQGGSTTYISYAGVFGDGGYTNTTAVAPRAPTTSAAVAHHAVRATAVSPSLLTPDDFGSSGSVTGSVSGSGRCVHPSPSPHNMAAAALPPSASPMATDYSPVLLSLSPSLPSSALPAATQLGHGVAGRDAHTMMPTETGGAGLLSGAVSGSAPPSQSQLSPMLLSDSAGSPPLPGEQQHQYYRHHHHHAGLVTRLQYSQSPAAFPQTPNTNPWAANPAAAGVQPSPGGAFGATTPGTGSGHHMGGSGSPYMGTMASPANAGIPPGMGMGIGTGALPPPGLGAFDTSSLSARCPRTC